MKKNLSLLFLVSFLASAVIVYGILQWQKSLLIRQHAREAIILQDDVKERFKLLIESPLAIGVVSAEYFSSGEMNEKSYQQLANNIIGNFDEMLGLNVLDHKGRIVRVFPHRENLPGLGKVSQNYQQFLASLKRNEPYWLSPPFELYQGPDGFTFYIPIHVRGKLFGWVAPVISVDRFFRKFIKSEFLETYHLIIQDQETGKAYFKTAEFPSLQKELKHHQLSSEIKGRKINFISWRKDLFSTQYDWPISFGIAAVVAGILTFSLSLYEQRKFIKDQLADVEALLKLTVADTSTSFATIRGQLDLMKMGTAPLSLDRISKHVSYIETLVEQIKILQNMSATVDFRKQGRTALLPLFLELSELWNEKLREKNLLLNYNPEELANTRVAGNQWLLCHSIFGNILAEAIHSSPIGGNIDITCSQEDGYHFIIFHNQVTKQPLKEKIFSQGLNIAQKVTQLHQGELLVKNDTKGEETITVKLSVL